MLNHVKCQACGTAYNGKSVQSKTAGIALYIAVMGFAALVLIMIVVALGVFR